MPSTWQGLERPCTALWCISHFSQAHQQADPFCVCTTLHGEAEPACYWHLQQASVATASGAVRKSYVFTKTSAEPVASSLHIWQAQVCSAPSGAVCSMQGLL